MKKKMLKKFLVVVSIAALAAGSLGACSAEKNNSSAAVENTENAENTNSVEEKAENAENTNSVEEKTDNAEIAENINIAEEKADNADSAADANKAEHPVVTIVTTEEGKVFPEAPSDPEEKQGLKAGVVYGNPDEVSFTVNEDMDLLTTAVNDGVETSLAANVLGTDYVGYFHGSTNAHYEDKEKNKVKNMKEGIDVIPETGAFVTFSVAKDAVITILVNYSPEKSYVIAKKEGDKAPQIVCKPAFVGELTFEAKAGETYYNYNCRSKPLIYSISYQLTDSAEQNE